MAARLVTFCQLCRRTRRCHNRSCGTFPEFPAQVVKVQSAYNLDGSRLASSKKVFESRRAVYLNSTSAAVIPNGHDYYHVFQVHDLATPLRAAK